MLSVVFTLLFFLRPTELVASDLGRHLINGKEILAGNWGVFTTNHYSYTTPDFPFVNHHWLFGLISYLLYQVGGWSLITVVWALLYTLAPAIISLWWLPKSRFKWLIAAASMLMALPMLHSRVESRPEAISAICLALTPFLWRWWVEAKSLRRMMWVGAAFVALMVVWVNSHIFWIFAPLVGGGYFIEAIMEKDWGRLQRIVILGLILLASCLATPLGIKIVLYPFGIFTNYAYPVAENQTVFFFLQNFASTRWWLHLLFIIFFGSLLALFWKVTIKPLRPMLYGTVVLFFCSLLMVRFASFAGLFVIPLISWYLYLLAEGIKFIKKKYNLTTQSPLTAMMISLGATVVITYGFFFQLYNPFYSDFRIGLSKDVQAAGEFLHKPELADKQIFNDYDIGGYLIWHAPRPNYVYFDNRPEAYPQEFVEGEAILAQTSDEKFAEVAAQRNIELIVFYRYDATSWGQPFLIRRMIDQENWATVFADEYVIILLKNTPENKAFIDEYKIDPATEINYN